MCIKDFELLKLYNVFIERGAKLKKISSRDILAINLKYYRYKLNLSQEKFAEKIK